MSSSWTLEEFKNAIVEDITSPTVFSVFTNYFIPNSNKR